MAINQITQLSGLDITPDLENKNNGLYVPQLTSTQINEIPAKTLRNGGIIYNTNTNSFQTYAQGAWNNLASYRTGAITNIGDVGGAGNPNLACTGAIISASKGEPVNNDSNLITITYTDLGYVPFIFISLLEANHYFIVQVLIPGATASQAQFFLQEVQGEVQDAQVQILLMQPNL